MNETLGQVYLESVVKRLLTYKTLGERTFGQLEEKDFYFVPGINAARAPDPESPVSNSIAVIIRHMSGNMMSRWTNFLTEDGEKEGRDREKEFSAPALSRDQLLELWEKGWACLLDALLSLKEEDLLQTIHIRHEPLFAIDAINRQLAHYPHHVGQIVYIGKMIRDKDWQSLSIPKGASGHFNQQMKQQHGS
ncbi:MAG TPA: DUF1572 family protein [Puia sp.]